MIGGVGKNWYEQHLQKLKLEEHQNVALQVYYDPKGNEFDLAFIGMPAKWARLSKEDIQALRLCKDDVLICRKVVL